MSAARIFAWFPPRRLTVAALSSGVLLALSFPPFSISFVSFIALVPVFVALHRGPISKKTFYKTGYTFGVAFHLVLLWWVVRLSASASITIPWLMFPALALLVMYLSVYPGLFFLLLRAFGKQRVAALIILSPALWTLVEFFRSNGELGFPWGALGYSLSAQPSMMQGAAYLGLFGLGALIVLVNALLSAGLLAMRSRQGVVYLMSGALILIAMFVWGSQRVTQFSNGTSPDVRVAIVQPNVDLALKWEPTFRDSTFNLIERLSNQAALSEPDLILFPETCAPVYIRHDGIYAQRLSDLAKKHQTPILIGFLDARYDGPDAELNIYNSSGVFSMSGELNQYDKTHLLPFGEAIPWAWKYTGLKKIDFGQANFQPGPSRPVLESQVGELGALICFEAIFPDLSRHYASQGADFLVNITNDGWFGDTPGPYQHNAMSILRAVENHRYLLRSANSGVSMIVDPVGRVVSTVEVNKETILVGEVARVGGSTLYTRTGDRPLLGVCVFLTLIGIIVGRSRGVRELPK